MSPSADAHHSASADSIPESSTAATASASTSSPAPLASGIRQPSSSQTDPTGSLRNRRHRSHASSSFRIESPGEVGLSTGWRRSRPSASAIPELSKKEGKRRNEDDAPGLFVQKRRFSRRHGHEYRGRFELERAASPLAPPAINASPDARGDTLPLPDTDVGTSEGGIAAPSSRAVSRHAGDNTPQEFDKDAAQIVNLALSLNESRRRASAGVGRALTNAGLRDRRVSSVHRASPTPRHPEPSWRDLVKSPEDGNALRHRNITPSPGVPDRYLDDGGYDFSDATLARAEKARKHFELWGEYVRLLPHLPPLRPPATNRKFDEAASDVKGARPYNPLQYIRNRKIRFRERSAINTEIHGWEDVENVHAWVDTVTACYETSGEPEVCIQLPPVKPKSPTDASGAGFSPASPTSSRPQGTETKPKRPRMDWLFSPSDLLADVAWLEEGSNKAKIEDRDGKKIFPPETKFRTVSLTGDPVPRVVTPPPEDEKPDTLERNRESLKAEPLPNFTSLASQISHGHRGRRRHRLANSMSLTPSHSHVRKSSKSRWHKALGRSPSTSSSSSSSDSEDGGWRRKLARWYSDTPSQAGEEGLPESALQTPSKDRQGRLVSPRESYLGPLQYYRATGARAPSHHRSYTHSAASTASDKDGLLSRRLSLVDTGADSNTSTTQAPHFPSIAINLSPPRSRSPSPKKNSLPFGLAPAKNAQDYNTPEPGTIPPDMSPARLSVSNDDRLKSDIRRLESLPAKLRRGASHQESRIRGMFKGGRIAELVGNEVSKVGDFIRKRDGPSHSRSSSASSLFSEYALGGDDTGKGKTKLRSNKTLQESGGDASRRSSLGQKDTVQAKPPIWVTPPATGTGRGASDTSLATRFSSPADTQIPTAGDTRLEDSLKPEEPSSVQKVVFRSTSRERRQDSEHTEAQQQLKRPRLADTTRNWSMSSRSITRLAESARVDKREIAAVRAHLLSSGTKALQIRRTAHNGICVHAPNEFNALHAVISREAIVVAQSLISTFDSRCSDLRHSMTNFSHTKVPGLISELDHLENLISTTLSPRMHTMAVEADQLTGELSTTSTLKVKRLNDELDRGIRRRNRRFRRISRLGFVMLEWFVVGVMWIAWMLVMVFKIGRGVWRGVVGGVRWVLWL